MAKILLSFLGSGLYDPKEYRLPVIKEGKESYDDVPETNICDTAFLFDSLKRKFCVDKLFLVGTIRSGWSILYDEFAKKRNCFDKKISKMIEQETDSSNHFTSLDTFKHKNIVESVLGDKSEIVLIHYGLNSEEIKKNSEIILGLDINEGDELYVDITHGFRSLPMVIMNTLIYLKNVKKVKIRNVLYGMSEVCEAQEGFDFVPIVDLSNLLDISDWITASYSLEQYGNAYEICNLVEDKTSKSLLTKFSDSVNMNSLSSIESYVGKLPDMQKAHYGNFGDIFIPEILKKYQKKFGVFDEKKNWCAKSGSSFQLELAIWQKNHFNYGGAYIALDEAIITKVCEINGLSPTTDKDNRDKAKGMIPEDLKVWHKIHFNRTCIAHSIRPDDLAKEKGVKRYDKTVEEMIKTLHDSIGEVKDFILKS